LHEQVSMTFGNRVPQINQFCARSTLQIAPTGYVSSGAISALYPAAVKVAVAVVPLETNCAVPSVVPLTSVIVATHVAGIVVTPCRLPTVTAIALWPLASVVSVWASSCVPVALLVIVSVNGWLAKFVNIRLGCTCAVPAAAFNVAVNVPDAVIVVPVVVVAAVVVVVVVAVKVAVAVVPLETNCAVPSVVPLTSVIVATHVAGIVVTPCRLLMVTLTRFILLASVVPVWVSSCVPVALLVIVIVNGWLAKFVKVRLGCTCAVPIAAFSVAVNVPETVDVVVPVVVVAVVVVLAVKVAVAIVPLETN